MKKIIGWIYCIPEMCGYVLILCSLPFMFFSPLMVLALLFGIEKDLPLSRPIEFFFWSIGAFVIGLVLIKITEKLNGERIGSLPNIFPFKYIFKIDKKDEHN